MVIIDTYEIVKASLYSVQFNTESVNEFRRIFDFWRNATSLESFFEIHKNDLEQDFWNSISIEDAILKTRSEAVRLEQKIIQIAEKGRTDKSETLSTLFKPLHNETTYISKFESSKVAGVNKSSWIRIYAIRIEANLFLVTGGAIKLTKTMNDREHLLKELKKLNITKAFLSDEDNIDDFPIFELFI